MSGVGDKREKKEEGQAETVTSFRKPLVCVWGGGGVEMAQWAKNLPYKHNMALDRAGQCGLLESHRMA